MTRDVTVVAGLTAAFLPLFFICQNQIEFSHLREGVKT